MPSTPPPPSPPPPQDLTSNLVFYGIGIFVMLVVVLVLLVKAYETMSGFVFFIIKVWITIYLIRITETPIRRALANVPWLGLLTDAYLSGFMGNNGTRFGF